MEILERQEDLDRVSDAFFGWPKGGGSALLISGEAGIGKTTLVDLFERRALAGRRVHRGYCDRGAGVRAFGPFLDFAESFDSRLAPLLGSGSRFREQLPAMLEIVGSRPAIVVLEDIHNADDASLGLIHFLLRRLRDLPLFLIATFRDNELTLDHPLNGVLGSIASDSRIEHIRLKRLSAGAVSAAAGLEDGHPDACALYRRSGGNPFLVRALLEDGGGDRIPRSFRDLIRGKLSALSKPARDFILVAAIQRRLDPALVTGFLGDWTSLEAECLRQGLLERAGGELAFPHELTRETVLAQSDSHRIAHWHGRVFDALVDAGESDPERLAHHAAGSGRRAETRVWGLAAARASLARDARREAGRHASSALALVRGEDATTAELLELLAAVRISTDRLAEGLAHLAEAARLWRGTGQPARAAVCRSKSAIPLVRLGRNREADEAAAAAVESLESGGDSPALAAALTTCAYLRMLGRDTALCLHFGNRAIAMAERLSERHVLAEALMIVGSSLIVTDDPAGLPPVERAIAIATAERRSELVARCYANLGSAYGEQVRYAEARRFLEEGLRYCEAHDLDEVANYKRCWLALVELHTGRLQAARDRAAALLSSIDLPSISRIMALIAFGRASSRLGAPDGKAALEEALGLARATGTLQRIAPACLAAAEAALQDGEIERARELAVEAHEPAIAHRHAWFTGEAQLMMLRTGATPPHTPWIAPPFRQEIAGDVRGAAHNWAARGCPFEQARALEGGDLAARKEALAIYDSLGALPAGDRLRRSLRREGVRGLTMAPRRRAVSNPAGMTERQTEVARLLCEGLADAEIADRLRLSTKTVGHHVSAILAKLGVTSRRHVGRALSGAEQAAADRKP